MPNTLGKLRAIGLAAFPTWWLAAQQLAAQQVKQYAAATAASHSAANNIGGRSGSKTRRSGRSRRSARRMAALHSPEMPGSRRKERELTGFIGGSSLLGKKDYALSPSPPVAEDHDTNRGSEHAESSSFESDYSSGVASCSTCDGHSSDLSLSSDSSSSSNENVPIRGSRHAGRKASMVSREKKSSVKSQAAAPITSISQGKKKVEILARDDYNAPTYFSDAKPNTTTPLQRIIHHHTQDRNQDRDRYYQLREQEPTPSTPRNLLLRRQSDTLESEIAAAVAATDARSRMLAEKGYSTRADRNERKENSKSHILTSSHSVIDGLGYRIPHSVVSTDNQKKGKETERLIDV
ncbi:hypothetical protein F5Y16DRAFT_34230 [Xylariaceae sp. FL0255]|nr:hypothetical protein F5Y16DRAFT_34230 [Xylariaceae sp. FL0255]